MSLEEKLAKLNPTKYDRRSAADILAWKDRVPELAALADWLGHPVTQQWMRGKHEEVARIQAKLSTDRTLTQAQRDQLFGEMDAHQFDLAQFRKNPAAELETIERHVDLELSA